MSAFTHNRGGLGELLQSITSTKPGGAVIGRHTYTYGTFGEIAIWKREAPLANPSGPSWQSPWNF